MIYNLYYFTILVMKYKKNTKQILKIQLFLKKKLSIIIKLRKEIEFINNIINQINKRLDNSFLINIITQNEYKIFMEEIDTLNNFISSIDKKKTFYQKQFLIAKIKLNLIDIMKNIGSDEIKDILLLILNFEENEVDLKYNKLVNFYNSKFNPISYSIYNSDNNISFSNVKNDNIKLTTKQLNYPSCNKISIFSKTLNMKLNGAKLYFPYKNKLLVIFGFFNKDNCNSYQENELFKDKFTNLKKKINDLDNIPDFFKKDYLSQINIRDFITRNEKYLVDICINYYNNIKKIKNKDISTLIKEFILSNLEKQINLIKILLIECSTESSYIAYLLYDLILSDNSLETDGFKHHKLIYMHLHWSLQNKLKNSEKKIKEINNNLMEYNEKKIPYEKRIHLMKTNNYIKSKAFEKYKEISNSKGNENNAKAQHYLDGLLKIPFGIYKTDSLKYKLNDTISKIENLKYKCYNSIQIIEEKYALSDKSLEIIERFKNIIESNDNNIKYYNNFIELISLHISKTQNLNLIFNQISKSKKSVLIDILDFLNISFNKSLKKTELINLLKDKEINNCQFIHIKRKLNLINCEFKHLYETEEYQKINNYFQEIIDIWSKYKEEQKRYLQRVNKDLNDAVYGSEQAKKQIKHIIAQWINGNNNGYVFGFEGPPGTGKTTLAKKGIAKCLKDEDGNNRPFVFIALGGSSNGSTLDGHNYTYVGSTWGRIIDALMKSKCMNPIIYIDELDKISKTEHGKEIVGILTHMTDLSQNEEFADKYFSGIKFDISKCLIIFSYNDPSLIDKILLDRIHRISIDAINNPDKVIIAKKYILPNIYKNVGYKQEDIILKNDSILFIIENYTLEAGVRKLKEKLYEIIREVNVLYLNDKIEFPFTVNQQFIQNLFYKYDKVDIKKINQKDKIGLINGLFATSLGIGGITTIEVVKNVSKKCLELELTGHQGNIMKESMSVAKTVALNNIPDTRLKKIIEDDFGIHIHCPSGATPKDGPSAGTAITLAIISLLTSKKIKHNYAITGEIDLNGNVLKIGGLESKLNGAKRAGVNVVLCPKENQFDIEKIRKKNMLEDDSFKIILVKNIKDCMKLMYT